MLEKRKLQRFDLKLRASVVFADSRGRSTKLEAQTKDICSGGAFLLTKQDLPRGTDLQIGIDLDNTLQQHQSCPTRLNCRGRVIRTEQGGVAVCFSSCELEVLDHLRWQPSGN